MMRGISSEPKNNLNVQPYFFIFFLDINPKLIYDIQRYFNVKIEFWYDNIKLIGFEEVEEKNIGCGIKIRVHRKKTRKRKYLTNKSLGI